MKTAKKSITNEKENGRIYTPDYIVKQILDLSRYVGDFILKKHVIDNSCGDGSFLCEIVKRYCEVAKECQMPSDELCRDLETYVHGIEIEPTEREKCICNVSKIAQSFGLENIQWDIICGDTLTIHQYDGVMNFVVGNPPYVRVHHLGESLDDIKNFSFAQGGMTDLFIVFYEIGIQMLSEDGILGYITPSSFFNSLAGACLRKTLVCQNLLDRLVDLKHYQAFPSTTYTSIVILKKDKNEDTMEYYGYDSDCRMPYSIDTLAPEDYYIEDNYYFASKKDLQILKRIFLNRKRCDVAVKNGYATLCDDVFIHDFSFDSPWIIPVVKASKGIRQKIFFPYDSCGKLIPEETIQQDMEMYAYLQNNREKLLKRSNERSNEKFWYAFGRSQAISDTFKDKLAINSLLRNENDFKFVEAPSGIGVYGGLYITSDTISFETIKAVLRSKDFITYITLIGKYKSGGYYTFSSKDVKAFLDYKFCVAEDCSKC